MTTKARNIPFQFSSTQSYNLEFGPLYIRFFYNPGTGWAQITSGGLPVEKITPYLETELFEIKFCQTADTMYLFHPKHPVQKLTRTSHTSWTLTECAFTGGAPKEITSITNGAPPIITSVAHGLSNGDKVKVENVIGMVEVNGAVWTVANKTADTFEVLGGDATGLHPYIAGGILIYVSGDAPSIFNSTGHYPSCGCFYEQRLMLAGFDDDLAFYGSVSGDYENFIQDPELDDGAIVYTPVTELVDKIRWMSGQEVLIAGTVGGILKISASSLAEPLTQTNISVRSQIAIGCADIQPQMLTDSLVFVTGSGRSIRQLTFDELSQKWTAPDLTKIAKHITIGTTEATSGIVQMAFQTEPIPILWCIRADGQLLGFVYDNLENVKGWFRVVTYGLFESVSVNKTDGKEDTVFVVVNRTIGGVALRYIEYFMPHEFFGVLADSFFVHSGLTSTLAGATQVTGLTHLASKEVDVVIAGVYIGRKTVSAGGVVTLGATYSGKCHIGLPYTSIVEPMYLNSQGDKGSSQTKKQIISGVDVYFYQTGTGVEIGPSTSNLKDVLLNELEVNDAVEYLNEIFTADVPVVFDGDWGTRSSIVIQQADPLPMTVLEIVPRLNINEED